MKTAIRQILLSPRRDPFLSDVVLFVQGNGADSGTVFTDSSQFNHTIIRAGGTNITTSTTQSKYGGSSLFSNSNTLDSRLDITNNSVFNIGAKNFTIEFWYYKTSNFFTNNIIELFTLDGLDFPLAIYDGSFFGNRPNLSWGSNSAWVNPGFESNNAAVPLNQWVHIAFCRSEGFMRSFFNGQITNIVADTSTIGTPASNPTLMAPRASGFYGTMLGYMDNFRFTMAGRYDQNFNPERNTFMRG